MTRVYDIDSIDRWAGGTGSVPPVLSLLTPATADEGDTDTAVTATGSNFAVGAVIEVDNVPLTTVRVNSTTITFTMPTSILAAGGNKIVKVRNPGPGGGLSNSQIFIVNDITEFAIVMIDGSTGTGKHETAISTDGATFSTAGQTPTGGSSAGFDVVIYNETADRILITWAGKFGISDDQGATDYSSGGTLGGLNWEMIEWCPGFNSGAGTYQAGSSNSGIAYSADADSGNWTSGSPGSGIYTGLTSGLRIQRGMAYSRSLDILVGVGYQGVTTVGAIVYATDFDTWSEVTTSLADQCVGVDWIPELGKFFVQVQNGDIMYSSNGTSFSTVSSAVTTGGGLCSFAYSEADEILVLADQNTGLWSSDDEGLTWTLREGTSVARNVVYSKLGGQFIAPNKDNTIWTSSDGITWSNDSTGLSPSGAWYWCALLDTSPA